MATTDTTQISNQYRTHFSKMLLDTVVEEVRLNEFAMEAELPRRIGSKEIQWFYRAPAVASNVQALTEGTPITVFASHSLSTVSKELVLLGEAAKITEKVDWTGFFNMLEMESVAMGEDAALDADTRSRNEIVAGVTTSGQRRYAQGAPDWATLAGRNVEQAKFKSQDGLDAMTKLKKNRAKKINGCYPCLLEPEGMRDLRLDPRWVDAAKYGATRQLFKDEVGELDGVRYVEHTNPFVEDGADAGSQGTSDDTGLQADKIYTAIILGKGAFGVPKLAGTNSPWKPQITLVTEPDHADPLGQTKIAGWIAYWATKLLREIFVCTIRHKTAWAG